MHGAAPAHAPRGGEALARLPEALPPWSRGWMAALAGVLEASAPKPGNVHPGAAFDDLCYDELVAAAVRCNYGQMPDVRCFKRHCGLMTDIFISNVSALNLFCA